MEKPLNIFERFFYVSTRNFMILRFSSILESNVCINLQEINIYNRCECERNLIYAI